jgi:hypothetical protein
MDPSDYLDAAVAAIKDLPGREYDILELRKPDSVEVAVEVAQTINKISPIVGNTIEFGVAEYLNKQMDLPDGVYWRRQDPEFPDVILDGLSNATPGIEIKAWYPLSTEMTGRFRESQRHMQDGLTRLAVLAWLPEFVIYGEPTVIDVFVDDALKVAQSRDDKYHEPPDYLVIEPEDTSNRTRNLQQSNVRGHKIQENDPEVIQEAEQMVADLSLDANSYDPSFDYHRRLKRLYSAFSYRQESNFAKLSRLGYGPLDRFEKNTMDMIYKGRSVKDWRSKTKDGDRDAVQELLNQSFTQESLGDFSED